MIAVERLRNPDLAGCPLVVGGRPPLRGVVAAASAEARAAGVASGRSLAEAADLCPAAVFLEGSFQHYFEASQALDAVVRRHCTMVEWMSLDEAYLDLTSRAPADARRACADIQRDIAASLCVDVAIGMAASKVVARVASRLARPRGLLYVLPGYEARLLAPLDPAVLPGLDAAAVAALKAAGVTALGELAALDPAAAAVMLGRSGPVLVRHAGAVDDQPVLGTTVPKAVGAGADVSTPDAAIDVLLRVVQMAAQDLRRQGLLARTASVTTRYPDGSTSTRCTTLRDPTSADDDLVAALRRLLPRLVRTPTPVVRLEVSLAALVRADRQLSLFGPRTTTVLPDRRHA